MFHVIGACKGTSLKTTLQMLADLLSYGPVQLVRNSGYVDVVVSCLVIHESDVKDFW